LARNSRAGGEDAAELRATIEGFLKNCREPALLEPGEEMLPLTGENYALEIHASRLTIQAWDQARNWTRRIIAITQATNARLEMTVERFARREGKLFLLDVARKGGADAAKKSERLVFRERFRLFLRRQFPEWTLSEISAEANLEFSLSPSFPRAFLKHGQRGWAAIACPQGGDAAAALSFGLIWLDYLRQRERRTTVEGLAIYVPTGSERAAALRLLCLDAAAARFVLFTYNDQDHVLSAEPRDYGNIDTRLEPCRRPSPNLASEWERVAALPGVERVAKHDGRVSLRVRGIEFAEMADGELQFGLGARRHAQPHHAGEIERLAEELDRARTADADDRGSLLYRQFPEAWLESQARAEIETIDATLRREPVYGQVPAFAGGDRGVLDLLAVDHAGRLAVVELKASADLHLPLQALDYWVRVKWHLDRGEFGANGYFPGIALRPEAPRLLLVSPSLEFHPTTEAILRFFAPQIEVERVGLAVEWRKRLQAVFRLKGAERPQ
jgi:hypothetical protein